MKCKISKMLFAALALGLTVPSFGQTKEERAKIVAGFENYEEVEAFAKQKSAEFEKEYAIALQIAEERGLPLSGTDEQGNFFQLVGLVKETGELKYYQTRNNNPTNGSIQTARAQYLSEGGGLNLNIQGQGMLVGIWDGGQPLATHVSLGMDRVFNGDGSTGEVTQGGSYHATHVGGTMVSSGVDNSTKGFAPMAEMWANNWLNDLSEMASQANQGLLLSNHSYGPVYASLNFHNNPAGLGRYNSTASELDAFLYLRPEYLPVYASGNDRNGGSSSGGQWVYFNQPRGGSDLLYGETVAKNNVVVGAVEGIGEYNEPGDVVMSSFSNWGPTDDFRVKPDISAKGVSVKSLSNASNTATAFENGTSMAAPAVTGVFVLWQQLHKQLFPFTGFMKAATLKALMAATADETGTYRAGNPPSGAWHLEAQGPSHRFGWGLINAQKGAQVMQWVKSGETNAVLEELTLDNNAEFTQTFVVPEEIEDGTPIIVTIAWTDPARSPISGTDSDTPALVNDLDLRLIRPNGTEVMPWKLTKNWVDLTAVRGDNDVDNIEKIEYINPFYGHAEPGVYTIKVTHKGNLTSGSQNFSLVAFSSDEPVSSKEYKFAGLELFPNPVSDLLNIKDSQGNLLGGTIEILDLQGKVLFTERDYNRGQSSFIDMSAFSTGVYMLKMSNKGKTQVEKIIKK